MRLLICGSREWIDPEPIETIIDGYRLVKNAKRPLVIIEGCASGADHIAHSYEAFGVEHEHFPADWKKYGRGAGPTRNAQMLAEGKPDVVWAFQIDESPGTNNMIQLARSAGVKTYVVKT